MQFKLSTAYNGRPVEIMVGFDQALNGYFMVITPEEETNPDANEETGFIYSNLDDTDLKFPRLTPTLEHFRKRLMEMGLYSLDVKYFIRTVEVKTD